MTADTALAYNTHDDTSRLLAGRHHMRYITTIFHFFTSCEWVSLIELLKRPLMAKKETYTTKKIRGSFFYDPTETNVRILRRGAQASVTCCWRVQPLVYVDTHMLFCLWVEGSNAHKSAATLVSHRYVRSLSTILLWTRLWWVQL